MPPATPVKSKTTSLSILNARNQTKIKELRKALAYHDLLIHDRSPDLKEHLQMKQAVSEILKGERGSVAKKDLWENLEAVCLRYEWANEVTFLVHFVLAGPYPYVLLSSVREATIVQSAQAYSSR